MVCLTRQECVDLFLLSDLAPDLAQQQLHLDIKTASTLLLKSFRMQQSFETGSTIAQTNDLVSQKTCESMHPLYYKFVLFTEFAQKQACFTKELEVLPLLEY